MIKLVVYWPKLYFLGDQIATLSPSQISCYIHQVIYEWKFIAGGYHSMLWWLAEHSGSHRGIYFWIMTATVCRLRKAQHSLSYRTYYLIWQRAHILLPKTFFRDLIFHLCQRRLSLSRPLKTICHRKLLEYVLAVVCIIHKLYSYGESRAREPVWRDRVYQLHARQCPNVPQQRIHCAATAGAERGRHRSSTVGAKTRRFEIYIHRV